MMRSTILIVGLALVAAGPAWAQESDEAEVAIDGRVARLCVLGEPSQATVDLGQMAATSGSRVGRIAALSDVTVTLPGSFCNFAGSIASVEATALVETGSGMPPTGFAKAVNFTATASGWGDTAASATTAAGTDGTSPTASGDSSVQPQPRQSDIAVQLSDYTVPGDALLVAGNYSGLVRVTLGPATISQGD
jgi:hypothetical protein